MISFLVNKYKIILNHSNNLLLFIPWWCVVHDQRPMCNTHAHFIFYKRIFFCLPHSTTQAPRHLLRSRLKPCLHRHVFRSSLPLLFNRHVSSVDMGDFLPNWTPNHVSQLFWKLKSRDLVIYSTLFSHSVSPFTRQTFPVCNPWCSATTLSSKACSATFSIRSLYLPSSKKQPNQTTNQPNNKPNNKRK